MALRRWGLKHDVTIMKNVHSIQIESLFVHHAWRRQIFQGKALSSRKEAFRLQQSQGQVPDICRSLHCVFSRNEWPIAKETPQLHEDDPKVIGLCNDVELERGLTTLHRYNVHAIIDNSFWSCSFIVLGTGYITDTSCLSQHPVNCLKHINHAF